jgi:hypothetical protein
VATRWPLKCIGDVDALIKLGFYRVPYSWLNKQFPNGCDQALNLLTKEQVQEILLPEGSYRQKPSEIIMD